MLAGMRELSAEYGLRVANVFHAGDGNLHPLILYDANKPGELEQAESFGADILRLCVEVGGVLTGEHGVGVEKRDLMPEMFNADRPRPADAGQMRLRPEPSAQSRKSVPAAAPLRRARPHACAPGAGGVSGHSEVLSDWSSQRLGVPRSRKRGRGAPASPSRRGGSVDRQPSRRRRRSRRDASSHGDNLAEDALGTNSRPRMLGGTSSRAQMSDRPYVADFACRSERRSMSWTAAGMRTVNTIGERRIHGEWTYSRRFADLHERSMSLANREGLPKRFVASSTAACEESRA